MVDVTVADVAGCVSSPAETLSNGCPADAADDTRNAKDDGSHDQDVHEHGGEGGVASVHAVGSFFLVGEVAADAGLRVGAGSAVGETLVAVSDVHVVASTAAVAAR